MSPGLVESLERLRAADLALAESSPSPFPLRAMGLEAVIAGGVLGASDRSWVFPGLRERVGAVLRGCPVQRLADGHAGAPEHLFAPAGTSPAARALHACGMAMALGPTRPVLCFLGQGAAATGAFYEALNLAAILRLHVVFLVHALDLSHPDSPLVPQVAGGISAKALAFGIPADTVDGGLASEVRSAVAAAMAREGPRLIEARLQRGEDPLARARERAAGAETAS